MILKAYTILHVIISLLGILSGFVVMAGMIKANPLEGWTQFFLWTTVLTSVTGFFFPFQRLMPSHIFGIISLVVLAAVIYARYPGQLAGGWRLTYVLGAIFAFFIVDVYTKRVVHVAVTRAPTQGWTAQQLRNALPFDGGPQFIIRDRDDKFGAEFDRVAKGAGTRVIRSAVRAPLINSVCERFLGTVRRECLDHVVILGEHHLRSVLEKFSFTYFNVARPHQGLAHRVPAPASTESRNHGGTIVTTPVLGGLHHDYRRVA